MHKIECGCYILVHVSEKIWLFTNVLVGFNLIENKQQLTVLCSVRYWNRQYWNRQRSPFHYTQKALYCRLEKKLDFLGIEGPNLRCRATFCTAELMVIVKLVVLIGHTPPTL